MFSTPTENVDNKLGFAFEIDDTMDRLIEELEIEKTVGTDNELKEIYLKKIDGK